MPRSLRVITHVSYDFKAVQKNEKLLRSFRGGESAMDQNLMTEKFFKASQDAGASNVAQDYSENRLCNEPAGKAPWRTGLTVICIFFMLISFLGFLSAGYGLYGLFNPPKEEVAAKKSKGYQPKGRSKAGSSAKFEENFKQARDTYFPVLTYLEVMKLILALSFTVAVVMMISRSPKARVFVMGLCGVALFYHISRHSFLVSLRIWYS